jgi:WD40 repeat protein
MKKIVVLVICIMVLLIASCTPQTATVLPPTNLPPEKTATTEASPTAIPSNTPTALPPTETPLPTVTYTPLPTPTATPPVISAETARELALIGRLGGGALLDVALSPDASRVAVLTSLAIVMFDTSSGEKLWEIPTRRVLEEIVFSGDGASVVGRTRGGSVLRWDASTGKGQGDPTSQVIDTIYTEISPMGEYLLATDPFEQTFVYDTSSGEQVQFNNGFAYPFGVSVAAVGAESFAVGGVDSKYNFQLRLWDIARGRFIGGLRGNAGEITNLRYSPDSKFVTGLGTKVVHGLEGIFEMYIWDAATGKLLDAVDLSLDTTDHTMLGDDATIVAGRGNGVILVFTLRIGERYSYAYQTNELHAHKAAVVSLASSADGLTFASAAADGEVKIWETQTGTELQSIQVDGLSLQTPTVAHISDQGVIERVHQPGAALSPDGTLLAQTSADLGAIDLVQLPGGELVKTFQIETGDYYANPTFSPDGKILAASVDDRWIVFWDLDSGVDIRRINTMHTSQITQLGYRPDGQEIASMGVGELFVWNPQDGNLLHSLTAFHDFTYSADSTLLYTDASGTGVYLLDASTGRRITYMDAYYVNDMAVSLDGSRLAVAGYRSPTRYRQEDLVYFLDLQKQRPVTNIELSGYPAPVERLAYTPDGQALVTIDQYGNLYIWNASTGSLLSRFEEAVKLPASILISPDSRTLMIAGEDNTVQFYQVQP